LQDAILRHVVDGKVFLMVIIPSPQFLFGCASLSGKNSNASNAFAPKIAEFWVPTQKGFGHPGRLGGGPAELS
jgi:hypothetical protein